MTRKTKNIIERYSRWDGEKVCEVRVTLDKLHRERKKGQGILGVGVRKFDDGSWWVFWLKWAGAGMRWIGMDWVGVRLWDSRRWMIWERKGWKKEKVQIIIMTSATKVIVNELACPQSRLSLSLAFPLIPSEKRGETCRYSRNPNSGWLCTAWISVRWAGRDKWGGQWGIEEGLLRYGWCSWPWRGM